MEEEKNIKTKNLHNELRHNNNNMKAGRRLWHTVWIDRNKRRRRRQLNRSELKRNKENTQHSAHIGTTTLSVSDKLLLNFFFSLRLSFALALHRWVWSLKCPRKKMKITQFFFVSYPSATAAIRRSSERPHYHYA
jgi:hypothetical protein